MSHVSCLISPLSSLLCPLSSLLPAQSEPGGSTERPDLVPGLPAWQDPPGVMVLVVVGTGPPHVVAGLLAVRAHTSARPHTLPH